MTGRELQVAPCPNVVLAEMPDGGVLFDLDTKQYFSLNASGSLVWKLLESGEDLVELEATMARDRSDDALGLREFVAALAASGLVAPSHGNGAAGGAGATEVFPSDWVAPRVEPHGAPLSEVILSPFDPTTPIPE
jgi:hypothetical protein